MLTTNRFKLLSIINKWKINKISVMNVSNIINDNSSILPRVVFVESARTPFLQSNGMFRELLSVDLQRYALLGLLNRINIPINDIGHICCGNVVQECRTSNIAREAALTGGIPDNISCSTVTLACISSILSTYHISNMIKLGSIKAGIAGGVELLSDYPIRYNRKVRAALIDFPKSKTLKDKLKIGKTVLSNIFIPDLPSVTEFTTEESMGSSADRLAAAFCISREEQDEFAIRSNYLSANAISNGKFQEIVPVYVSTQTKKGCINADNGIRISTMEKLSKLKPAFVKYHGTVTAGNASFLTDGASAALITSDAYAKRLNLKAKVYLNEIMFVAQDPKNELLLSPAYVIPQILKKANLTLNDIDVFEIHEAFAGQVLANLKALDSDWFFGTIPIEKLNLWGGSLSIGHPFGATGIRLITHAANRLIEENGKYALIAACASGGHGAGMLLEICP